MCQLSSSPGALAQRVMPVSHRAHVTGSKIAKANEARPGEIRDGKTILLLLYAERIGLENPSGQESGTRKKADGARSVR